MKTWREHQGLTQMQAAAACGVDSMQWSKWERGELRPSPRNRERLFVGTGGAITSDQFVEAVPPDPQEENLAWRETAARRPRPPRSVT